MIKFDGESLRAALSDKVKQLGEAVGQEAMRAAAFAGADVFRDEAVINAEKSKDTGVLQRNIIIKRLDEEASDRRQAYIVTVRSGKFGTDGDAFYWRFVEDGHLIVRRNVASQITSITKRRKEAKAAETAEFGNSRVAAKPFMRPAYESKKEAAVEAMQAKLAEKVNEKLGGS